MPKLRDVWYPEAVLPPRRKDRLLLVRRDYVYRGDGEDIWAGEYDDPLLNEDYTSPSPSSGGGSAT